MREIDFGKFAITVHGEGDGFPSVAVSPIAGNPSFTDEVLRDVFGCLVHRLYVDGVMTKKVEASILDAYKHLVKMDDLGLAEKRRADPAA